MHSQFRISNSSDRVNLEIGVPHIQKLSADRHSEDIRIYCELTVEAQRLLSLEEEKLSNTTETMLVEPHYFNISCSNLTDQFIAQEKKEKVKHEITQNKMVKPTAEPTPPMFKAERRKSLDKKGIRENTFSRGIEEKRKRLENTAKKPPDVPDRVPPIKLPQLPTTPIPVSELPPDSVRSPPKKLPAMMPAFSSLTPIPLKDLNPKPKTSALPATTSSSDSISIQVPMMGPDGTQIMQTINVPKSVLASASDRPVLLTVTPKNGINKGQKQIVVLTKNAGGIGAAVKPHTQLGVNISGSGVNTPGKVVLSQRQGMPSNASSTSSPSKPVTDINSLLSQFKPVPSSELIQQGYQNLPSSSTTSSPSSSNPGVHNLVSGILQSTPVRAGQSNLAVPQLANLTPIPQSAVRPQQRIIHQIVRPGQVLPNGQQVIMQNGKPCLVSAPTALPQGKIVLTQKGQIIQGAQAQALAGKIINTSQGQFIIGANGQLLSTQKLIQNHLTNQTVKYVTVSQPMRTVVSGSGVVTYTSGAGLVNAVASSSPVSSSTVVSSTPQRVSIVLPQTPVSGASSQRGATLQLGASSQIVYTQPVGASPQQGGNPRLVSCSPVGASSQPVAPGTSSQSNNPAFNRMILNALSNRGLLSQQNGKFVYVGDKTGSPGAKPVISGSSPAQSSVSIPLSSLSQVQQQGKSMVQVIVSAPNLDSFTASPTLLKMASSLMENPTIAELINTPCETGGGDDSSGLNGDINLYGVKSLKPAGSDIKSKVFYYRDPRLPDSWYVGIESNSSGHTVSYYTASGEKLRSLSEVAHFLKHKLMILPSCRGIMPPCPIQEIPMLAELSPQNRLLVPNLVLPLVDASSPVIRQIDSEIITTHGVKRPAQISVGQEEKKSKIVFF